jgi:signal peptidase I
MDFDFALFLVIATAVSGIIWLIDAKFFAPGRPQVEEGESNEPILTEYARSLFPVFLIVLLLRSFLGEPFKIPSGSMMPTLLAGDFILVNKFSYGIRLPVLNTKILDTGSPERGDVMVFRYPKEPSINYIKRVVGVPGDKVSYINKVLYINGERASLQPVGNYSGVCSSGTATHLTENLLGVEHDILVCPDEGLPVASLEYTVKEGEYLAFGDNRDRSNDSRFWGTVPDELLVGKASFIWMSTDPKDSIFSLSQFRWDRFGESIK